LNRWNLLIEEAWDSYFSQEKELKDLIQKAENSRDGAVAKKSDQHVPAEAGKEITELPKAPQRKKIKSLADIEPKKPRRIGVVDISSTAEKSARDALKIY
jgi:hypothetical protein